MTTLPAKVTILIIGAGPSGLMMGAELGRFGLTPLLVDKKLPENSAKKPPSSTQDPPAGSLAGENDIPCLLHAESLEKLERMGLAEAIKGNGQAIEKLSLFFRGRRKGELSLADLGDAHSPQPFLLQIFLSDLLASLTAALPQKGKEIHWGWEVVKITPGREESEVVLLDSQGRPKAIHARWVIGTDGANSLVRHAMASGYGKEAYVPVFAAKANGPMPSPWPQDAKSLAVALGSSGSALLANGLNEPSGKKTVFFWGGVSSLATNIFRHGPETASHGEALIQRLIRALALPFTRAELTSPACRPGHSDLVWRDNLILAGKAVTQTCAPGFQDVNTAIRHGAALAWRLAYLNNGLGRERLLADYAARCHDDTKRPCERVFRKLFFGNSKGIRRLRPLLSLLLHPSRLYRGRAAQLLFRCLAGGGLFPHADEVLPPLPPKRLGARSGKRAPWGRYNDGRDLFASLGGTEHHLLIFEGLASNRMGFLRLQERLAQLMASYALTVTLHPIPAQEALTRRYGMSTLGFVLLDPDGQVAFRGEEKDLERFRDHLSTRYFPASNTS